MSVKLTRDCDTILPYGLKTTPFETVFKALQDVAGTVWDVDPTAYRAAIAWAYYLTHNRAPLVNLRDALTILPAIAVSEAVPLVKDYMDSAQLVELLAQWHDYRPSQAALERLYTAYGMTVDVRPITDDEGQEILPHPVERGAFYVIARAIEWGRGLTPEELAIVADRATPLGGKPVVIYALTDNRLDVATHARTAGASQVVWSDEPAEEYAPPAPPAQLVPIYIQSGNLYYQSSVKNDTYKSDSYCYAIYDDENRTIPHVFDWGKRNVFGNVVNGEFIPAESQTQAQLPSTTGADTGYRLCVNKRDSTDISGYLWLAWNSYQSGYAIFSSPRYLMIYDDAMSAWLNSNHTDENHAGLNIVTDFDYDYSKTYKILAFVNANGIKVNDEQLHGISFSDNSGKIKITLSEWTSLIAPAARIVFYAE
jgi:hypothetical protein